MPRPLISRAERDALWRELGAHFTERPVCPECCKFIPPALWDTHIAGHHEDRVGRAVEACFPPPKEVWP